MWKTSSKTVRTFIKSQPPSVRNDHEELRHALVKEFTSSAEEILGMVAGLHIRHSRHENPKDYYDRLRRTYFQGTNTPGLEVSPTCKSLFLQNLHPCIRTQVVLMTQ